MYCNEEVNILIGWREKLQAMRCNQQLKWQEGCKHKDMHNEHDMKNNIDTTHLECNFINSMSSFWTLYQEFQKCNWVVLGGYGNIEAHP